MAVADRPTSVNNYKGLREWLAEVDEIGELRTVRGASWEEEIGRIAEMLVHTEGAPHMPFCSSSFSSFARRGVM